MHQPQPSGWNRFAIEVTDQAAVVDKLRQAGARFHSEIIVGVGSKPMITEDPSGIPIELFVPILPEARLGKQ